MRYFSQLARETTARVLPSRQPSWLQPVSQVTLEVGSPIASDAEYHSNPPADAFSTQVKREPTMLPLDKQEQNASNLRGHSIHSAQRVIGAPQEQPRLAYDSQPGSAREHFPREAVRTPVDSADDSRSPSREKPSEVRESATLPVVSPTPVEAHQAMPTTLQGVLTEIARRQEALELRYQADQAVDRMTAAVTTMTSTAQRDNREEERVLVSIGSVVVQLEAEPQHAAPALGKPTLRRPPREVHNNWARSFLDR